MGRVGEGGRVVGGSEMEWESRQGVEDQGSGRRRTTIVPFERFSENAAGQSGSGTLAHVGGIVEGRGSGGLESVGVGGTLLQRRHLDQQVCRHVQAFP